MFGSYFIGISGGSASGKTAFIRALQAQFKEDELCLISQDNYYKSADNHILDENGKVNFDLPECIDIEAFEDDLKRLREGLIVERHEYLYQLEGKEAPLIILRPAPIVVVEGLFLFHFHRLFDQLDLKIFIDADEKIKLQRRLARDTKERGIDEELVRYQWVNHVQPAYDKFLKPFKNQADIVINNNDHFLNSLEVIKDHIKIKLRG